MDRGSLPPLEDDFSRALLGSAEADGPSNAAFAKAAAALGVGASLPASAAVAAGAAGIAGIARWSSTLGAKLALGLSGALLVGTGALLLRRTEPAKLVSPSALTLVRPANSPAAQTAPASAASVERVASALPLVVGSAAASSAERASAAADPLAAARPARRIASARASTRSSLAAQVQSLDRARVALGSGDSAAALREIARYRAAWPHGVFLTEASVLEIEALSARGERSLTAKRAADFVAAHPDSPQAERLRALIRVNAR